MQDENALNAVSAVEETKPGEVAPETGAGDAETAKPEAGEASKTFTQANVDEIVGKRLERDRKAIYKKLGVEGSEGIDALVSKAASSDAMKAKLDEANARIAELSEKMAYLTLNVSPAREDDIRAHFKGKGIEFSEQALAEALKTHPEWLNKKGEETPKTTIQTLGVEHSGGKKPETEAEKRRRIFGD